MLPGSVVLTWSGFAELRNTMTWHWNFDVMTSCFFFKIITSELLRHIEYRCLQTALLYEEPFITESKLKFTFSSDGRRWTHLISVALYPLYQMAAPLYCAQNYSGTTWSCLLSVGNAPSTAYLFLCCAPKCMINMCQYNPSCPLWG